MQKLIYIDRDKNKRLEEMQPLSFLGFVLWVMLCAGLVGLAMNMDHLAGILWGGQ